MVISFSSERHFLDTNASVDYINKNILMEGS